MPDRDVDGCYSDGFQPVPECHAGIAPVAVRRAQRFSMTPWSGRLDGFNPRIVALRDRAPVLPGAIGSTGSS